VKSPILSCALLLAGSLAFGQSTANNTSACSANGVPTAGCNAPGNNNNLPYLSNSADTGAQTTTVDPLPVYTSTLSIKSYLYSGATTRVAILHVPYFCNTSDPCNGHNVNGMEETNAAQILAQAQWMKTVGGDVVIEDFYGCGASCGQPSGQAYNLAITTALANAISSNPSTTPTFAIMLDAGSVNTDGGSGTGQCAPASGDQSACLITAYEDQMDYVAKTWLYQSYYEVNANDGHPIVLYFPDKGSWPDTNFATVFAAVAAHATAGQSCGSGCTYTTTVDFLDENAGGFSESGIAGGYAWPQPNDYTVSDQFCYLGSPCSFNYVGNFYSTARANPSKIAMGLIGKGFDDHNASWGTNRVTAQQCGQLPGLYAAQAGAAGYSSSSQLQYLIVATWNDYEEGTEVETGIYNCITINQPAISGGTLSWSLDKSDATYASTSTINSFQIYTGTSSPTTLYASGISPTATSYAAPSLAPGESAWVYMVGQPLIQNQLSPGVAQSFANLMVNVAGSGSVTSVPSGISCPSACSASYVSGTVVTLTATPSAGFTFTGWSGDCSGGSCVLTMTAGFIVTATFTGSGSSVGNLLQGPMTLNPPWAIVP
jgi:hypothetical protein